MLGGGLLFGAAVVVIGLSGMPFGQKLVFLISVTIIGLMLARVAQDVDEHHRRKSLFAALVIFFYRATPGVGEGYPWFTIDVLGFDEAFYGTLATLALALRFDEWTQEMFGFGAPIAFVDTTAAPPSSSSA
jgi:hypothetical protein